MDPVPPPVPSPPPALEPQPTASTSTSTEHPPPAPAPPLSKNALKKARKAELIAERKLERRAREREKRKEKKRQRSERIAAGEDVSDDGRSKKRAKLSAPKAPFGARVVVDLSFDDKMSDKEIISLCSQLAFAYSANRRSPTPIKSLLFTSLDGRTRERLESLNDAGYRRWAGTEWWSESYERLWQESKDTAPEAATGAGEGSGSADGADAKEEALGARAVAPQQSVVYLTADSPEELEELKEGETYIIGGICDHNRYKKLCLNKAKASGVRAAQLPIGRYLAHLPTRKVLTVNQVFEILVKWVETRDWEQALYAVIPKRKFQNGGAQEAADDGGGDEEEEKNDENENENEDGDGEDTKGGDGGDEEAGITGVVSTAV